MKRHFSNSLGNFGSRPFWFSLSPWSSWLAIMFIVNLNSQSILLMCLLLLLLLIFIQLPLWKTLHNRWFRFRALIRSWILFTFIFLILFPIFLLLISMFLLWRFIILKSFLTIIVMIWLFCLILIILKLLWNYLCIILFLILFPVHQIIATKNYKKN